MPTYAQSDLFSTLDAMTHGKSSTSQSRQNQLNRAVRFVYEDIDLRSAKRTSQLSPNLFRDQYNYAAPSDLKGRKVLDIRKQVNRHMADFWVLVDETDFDRRKGFGESLIALSDASFSRILKIDGIGGFDKAIIHNGDSLTANGTWAVVGGTDATNLTIDTENFISGGSLRFDTNSGGTTASIQNSTISPVIDLSNNYVNQSSLFLWVYIPQAVTISQITNFILQWGSSTSNYYSKTITTNNEGQTFHTGWNLLRFDWNTATLTGTVDASKINFLNFTITKSGAMAAQTAWRIDDIVARKGETYDVVYYSKYGWQTSAGAYQENATATTDVLNADTEEVEIILFKAAEFLAQELRDYQDANYFRDEYTKAKMAYQAQYQSETAPVVGSWGERIRI